MTAAEDLYNGWAVPRESIRPSAATNGTSTSSLTLTGYWRGYFDYLGGTGLTSALTVSIENDGTQLSGEKIEQDRRGSSVPSRASIVGVRDSVTVKFTAFGTPHSLAFNSVEYNGTVSEDGNTINGMWAFQIFDGPFEMHRVEICKNI